MILSVVDLFALNSISLLMELSTAVATSMHFLLFWSNWNVLQNGTSAHLKSKKSEKWDFMIKAIQQLFWVSKLFHKLFSHHSFLCFWQKAFFMSSTNSRSLIALRKQNSDENVRVGVFEFSINRPSQINLFCGWLLARCLEIYCLYHDTETDQLKPIIVSQSQISIFFAFTQNSGEFMSNEVRSTYLLPHVKALSFRVSSREYPTTWILKSTSEYSVFLRVVLVAQEGIRVQKVAHNRRHFFGFEFIAEKLFFDQDKIKEQ